MMASFSDTSSEPIVPPDSPGSSVSSRFQEEYEELLKYAVVVPTYDPRTVPKTLSDLKGSFPDRLSGKEDETLTEGDMSTEVEEEEDLQEEEDEIEDENPYGSNPGSLHNERPSLKKDLHQSTPLDRTPDLPQAMRTSAPSKLARPATDNLSSRLFDERDSEMGDFSRSVRVEEDVVYSSGVDPDLARMEGLLDTWTTDLTRNIMAEFSQSRVKSIEQHRMVLKKERERHASEVTQLQNEIESMKELLHTYEQSIERKDQVIANLTTGLQKQKEKLEMAKTFSEWKIRHNDTQREDFASNLASKHYNSVVTRKVWDAWHSVIENKWRQRVEKACQAKAAEVCMQLTNDYESRIASLNEALESSRGEVSRLQQERERYEETMKKAFMRGVCALNLEAMSMFHEQEQKEESTTSSQAGPATGGEEEDPLAGLGAAYIMSQEPLYNNEPPGAPPPRVVSVQSAPPARAKSQPVKVSQSTSSKVAGRTKLTTKVTARTDSGLRSGKTNNGTLNPPMSSVTVERHPPVNKETLGHATASHYKMPQSAIVQRKIAGQGPGNIPMVSPNIHNVKVVE